MKRITGARRIEGRRGERKKEETKEEDQIPLNTCFIVLLRSFPNLQTPEDLGKPGLSYITSHTHTCTQSVICPTTTSLPAPVFLSFFLPFFLCFQDFFSSADDALWHNETVKRSPVEAGAETKRVWGGGGV